MLANKSQHLQWMEIDLDKLVYNVKALRNHLTKGAKFSAVVKKNAYGCGAATIAKAALKAGADSLAVHSLEEAMVLRQAGITSPILVMGPILTTEVKHAVEQRLVCTVVDREIARALSKASEKSGDVTEVHVKVDTGLHRFGTSLEDAPSLISYIYRLSNLGLTGLYTHFSSADEIDRTQTKLQLYRFLKLAKDFPEIELMHAANSAATLQFPETHLDMVRVGIAIYGLYPSVSVKKTVSLKPILSLKTRVVRVHSLKIGEGVSYGLTWIAPKDSVVALVPFGYGHGLPRLLSNRGDVLIRGRRAPIRGVVCMDQSIIDVTHIPGMQVGDEVTIIGRQGDEEITASEIAGLTNTINYEIISRLPAALPRIYLQK